MSDVTELLEHRRSSYNLFAHAFLVMPTLAFVEDLTAIAATLNCDGAEHIRRFTAENAATEQAELLELISVDRTRLIRGITADGPVPPYESQFSDKDVFQVLERLNRIYAQANFRLSENVHDAPDQLGVELSFMAALITDEIEALRKGASADAPSCLRALGDDFLASSLGPFAQAYAREMAAKAQTGFYRGLALMLACFISEELEALEKSGS